MSWSAGVAGSRTSVNVSDRTQVGSRLRKRILIFAAALVIILSVAAVLGVKYWPFAEHAVQQDLAEASDSTVTIRAYHPTYFPSPGCVLEGVEFRHGADHFRLITIDKLIIEGSYSGILTRHVPRITSVGADVFIPPFGAKTEFHSQHSQLVVDQLVANGTMVEFESAEPQKHPLVFEVHQALLSSVRWGSPIQYRLKLHNPEPPGELAVEGKFGKWAEGHPQDTP